MISKNSKNRNNKGFSIIEICIVCVIMLVVMIPIFTLMSQGNAGTVHNRNEIISRNYAANIIAYLNLLPYNDVKELSKAELITLALENTETNLKIDLNDLGKNFDYFKTLDFNAYAKVSEFNNRFNKYKVVAVTVEWKETNKQTVSSLSLSGMVTNK